MKHASLFTGIGGFDLASEWAGWENIFSCEIDQFCRKVLKYHFPNTIQHEDIKTTDFTVYRGAIDILTGGFPCQPYSNAGKRKGKADDRHLWPEMLRAIKEIQPGWVVGENVHGIVSWNGGMVFDEVQTSMEAEGYEVFAFILPACGVGAPHRRDRVWFVAHSVNGGHRIDGWENREQDGIPEEYREAIYTGLLNGAITGITPDADLDGRIQSNGCGQIDSVHGNETLAVSDDGCEGWITPDTGSEQFQERAQDSITPDREENRTGLDDRIKRSGDTWTTPYSPSIGMEGNGTAWQQEPRTHAEEGLFMRGNARQNWSEFPTQSPLCSRDDGLSAGLDGITFSKHRNESIKAYGNAIVPQVALQIFKAIQQWTTSQNQPK